MLNFSNKGHTGFFSQGNQPLSSPAAQGRETRIDPDDGKPGNIDFWYQYALGLQKNVEGLIQNRDEVSRVAMERKAVDAGLRAVIRDLLKVLRQTNPNHPLLDKKNRDLVFAEFEKEEMDRLLKLNSMTKPWPRERPLENTSE